MPKPVRGLFFQIMIDRKSSIELVILPVLLRGDM